MEDADFEKHQSNSSKQFILLGTTFCGGLIHNCKQRE